MIRRRLSTKVWILVLLATFVPLFVGELLTLKVMEKLMIAQVHKKHEQLAKAGAGMVRDYIQTATTKLKSIAQMIRKDEDPKTQTKRLNTLLDPPDIFLEVSYWTVGTRPEVQAQVQQEAFGNAQSLNRFNPRAYNENVKQTVANWSLQEPIFQCATRGMTFAADTFEKVGEFPALAISVPSPGGAVLTANVDFRPVSSILGNLSSFLDGQCLSLSDHKGQKIFGSGSQWEIGPNDLQTSVEVGHGGWQVTVHQVRGLALAPLDEVKQKFWWVLIPAWLVAGVVANLIASLMVRPTLSLAKTADAIRRGDLSVRTGIRREDEIGQLAQAFDRMAEALQRLDQMKSDFVAHVSHELRTPLTSAKMALANVQEGLAGKESLARVQEDLDRLIRMVNELLDIARIEAGLALAKEPTNLGTLVRSSVETLRPMARVSLEVVGEGATIPLDPARVQQIVINLVDNALKYAKSQVGVAVQGREVRVTDDGPGVPPEHRDRIFEKFSKVETGPKPPGAGLGLSIARKLAQLHGGSLVCEGNAFVLKL